MSHRYVDIDDVLRLIDEHGGHGGATASAIAILQEEASEKQLERNGTQAQTIRAMQAAYDSLKSRSDEYRARLDHLKRVVREG